MLLPRSEHPLAKHAVSFKIPAPDDLLAHALKGVMDEAPNLDKSFVSDVIVGCAMPEAEQGMNVARMGLLLAGFPESVPGVTVNRFCSFWRPNRRDGCR